MTIHRTSFLLTSLLLMPAMGQGATQPAPAPAIDSADYQAQDGETKRAALWDAIAATPYDANDLPTGGAVSSALKLVWGKLTLRATFDDEGDLRPARNKTFHRWGTAVKVRYEPIVLGITARFDSSEARHPYTGIFRTGGVGIARLSLGLGDVGKLWAPGIGLKLFVDGQESVNVHAIPRDGAQASKDFMAATLSTQIDPTPLDGFLKLSAKADPTLRKVDHVAAVNADGTPEQVPHPPHHIEFRPGQAIQYTSAPDWGTEDFRTSLAKIPAGTVLYEVWAFFNEDDTHPVRIGFVKTESEFVASGFQDRRLHFKHVR